MNPVAVIFNDLHLKSGNEEEVRRSILHMIEYMIEENITIALFAGDWFHSRSFQRQALLSLTDELLNRFQMAGIVVHMIPGNHDKTLYVDVDSFLRVFKHHPAVRLYSNPSIIYVEDLEVTMMPFIEDEQQVEWIKHSKGTDVLISHFEMQGSTNLGRVSEKNSITRKDLSKWKKTYLGHYHNHHEITEDIVHLPSIRQNNFGEDIYKGFSVLHDDLSYKVIPGSFKRYIKEVIDVTEVTMKELKKMITRWSHSEDSIRFEFIGEESALKAIDKKMFKGTGIDVKMKYDSKYIAGVTEAPKVIETYNAESVKESFIEFCSEKGFNQEDGMVFLNNFLKEKSNG